MTALITAQERAQLLQGTGTVNSYGINNQEVIDILNDTVRSMKSTLPSKLQGRHVRSFLINLTSTYPTRNFQGHRLDPEDRFCYSACIVYPAFLASSIAIGFVTKSMTGMQTFLFPTIILAAPLTISLAGRCIEPLYNPVANVVIQGTHRYTVLKIRSLVKKLKVFASLPLRGPSLSIFLSERSIPQATYWEIVSKMSIGQQLELQKRRKNFVSIPCIREGFSQDSLRILNTIQSLNTFSVEDLEGTLYQLKEHMKKDPTIWEEIIKALTSEQFKHVEALLVQVGKEILHLSEDDISALIAKLRVVGQKLNTFSDQDLEKALCQLKKRMEDNSTTWKEIVKTLDPEKFESVQALLIQTGQEISNLSDDDISTLIAKLRVTGLRKVQITIEISGKYQKEVSAGYYDLIQYPYFQAMLKGGFAESGEGTINLSLEEGEEGALDALLHFIQTQEIELTEELARSIFPLSERFRIEDLSIICFNYLSINREKVTPVRYPFSLSMGPLASFFVHKESPSEFLSFLFKYGQTPFLIQKTQKMLQDAFKNAEATQDHPLLDALLTIGVEYANYDSCLDAFLVAHIRCNESNLWLTNSQFLELLFKHENLPRIQKKASNYLLSRVNADLSFLERCSNIPSLYEKVEAEYIKQMSKKTFRQLWQYAETHNQECLKNACKHFLLNSQEQSELLTLWEFGQLPRELTEVCKGSLDT